MDIKEKTKLEKKISLVSVVCLGVGATVGAGIFSTLSEVAAAAGSSLFMVLALLLCALYQIPSSFCYAELASAYPEDGGPYVYFREAGARPLAFLCGWATFFAIDAPGISVMVLAIANYLNLLIPIGATYTKIFGIAIVIIFTISHVCSVEKGGKLQSLITILKIVPFIFIIIVGCFYIDWSLFLSPTNYIIESGYQIGQNTNITYITLFFSAISLSSYSFDGIFAACNMTEEIKNPSKNIPVGLILTCLIVMFLYVGISSVASGLMPIEEIANSTAPIADMAAKFPIIGDSAGIIVAIIAIIVIIGAIASSLMYMPRVEFAMARDNLFFTPFKKIHPKFKTPYFSIIAFSTLVIIFTIIGNINNLLAYVTVVILLKNCGVFCTILVLRKKQTYHPKFISPLGYTMPILSIIFSAILCLSTFLAAPMYGTIGAVVIVVLGISIYFIWNRHIG